MAKTPYEILEVSASATPEQIKAAYRKLAQQYHPDKPTGDAERFKEVDAAYRFLTGDGPVDDARAELLERVHGLFMAWVESGDPERGNPIQELIRCIEGVKRDLRANIGQTTQAIRKRERILKRLISKKSGEMFLQDALRKDIAKHEASIRELELEVPRADEAITFLRDYDYQQGESASSPYAKLILSQFDSQSRF